MEDGIYQDQYVGNANEHNRLLKDLYSIYGEISLNPVINSMIQENLLGFTIKLARYKFVCRMIRKTDGVLEVGSGLGIGTLFLRQFAKEVVGIDVKEQLLQEASNLNGRDNVSYKHVDLFKWESDKKYDVVVSLDAIEHNE